MKYITSNGNGLDIPHLKVQLKGADKCKSGNHYRKRANHYKATIITEVTSKTKNTPKQLRSRQ